ncbi:2,3-bisphosphoglycerate-dependent phosphoglycerate mutase [Methylobacterium cerastii]|uniref:2,3-bisphosphoglycerate-dependent phosphoglycerate mutase n=1 Tax=Methylobacterium cerastii TaxID=932741 RepID=A0ABQ4QQH4_9HYPH|nr:MULTISPECIES: histidine phosphatase family protein [Methylobacterium]TXM69048.1 histidine phosphatase family protein [Methylobacterium sp. WL12]TXM91157.1 histidine phosphatase family protein [Methylobacterium sp. WL122]TXN79782.1 histidine phosphatase family protein [Methylobacterium sp. WL8]GJD47065.1 2,3-bisphosphoglycerate-dependent phosphoglycerate mutase [Methylobacterium cerastii]
MKPISTIYFIRHGQTDWNAEGRLQGQRDIALNAVGQVQAADAADRLAALAGERIAEAEFIASPLLRTRRTMEILRDRLGLAPAGYRSDPRLMEIDFGSWEGQTWAEIRRRDPGGASARDRDRWGYRPSGSSAESYAMLTERVAPVFADLGRSTVVVAHGGVARAMLVALGHLDIKAAPRIAVRQGAVLVVDAAGWRWA